MFIFSGTVLQRWRSLAADAKCDIEIVVKANCVLVTNEQRSNVLVTQELVSITLLRTMDHSVKFDTIKSGWSIVYWPHIFQA